MSCCRARLLAFATCLIVAPGIRPAAAAPVLLDRAFGPTPEIAYRFQHPHLAGDVEADFLMGFHEFSVALPVGADRTVWLAMPLLKLGFAGYRLSDETVWGNATFGLQSRRLGRAGNLSLGLNLQLPTAQANRDFYLIEILAHPLMWQTFLGDVLTVQGVFQSRVPVTADAALRFQFGPDVLFPTGDAEGSPLVHLRYGLGIEVQTGRVGASVEFAGFWETDGDGDGFSEDSHHVLAAGVSYAGHSVQPGLYYEIATDEDLGDYLDGLLGVRVIFTP